MSAYDISNLSKNQTSGTCTPRTLKMTRKQVVKAEKCEGHIVGVVKDCGQAKTDPVKVRAVTEWLLPAKKKQL